MLSVPKFSIAPPHATMKPSGSPGQSEALPLRRFVALSVRDAVSDTVNIRKFGACIARAIVAPRPLTVSSPVTIGNPFDDAPTAAMSRYVQPTARLMTSAPGSAFARSIAATKLGAEHPTTGAAFAAGAKMARPPTPNKTTAPTTPTRRQMLCDWLIALRLAEPLSIGSERSCFSDETAGGRVLDAPGPSGRQPWRRLGERGPAAARTIRTGFLRRG